MVNATVCDAMAIMFDALADATRLKMIVALMDGPKCVNELSEAAQISDSAASHQLRTLRLLRLVTAKREGRHIIYTLNDDHIFKLVNQAYEHVQEDEHE